MEEPFIEFERIKIANALHNLQTTAEAWGNEQCSLSMAQVLSSGRTGGGGGRWWEHVPLLGAHDLMTGSLVRSLSECHLGQYFSRMTILTLDWHLQKVDKCFSLSPQPP